MTTNKIEDEVYDLGEHGQIGANTASDLVRKHSVNFCNWIVQITDYELKKEKDPNKLFDKYLESL
jgi:hypothetical protein